MTTLASPCPQPAVTVPTSRPNAVHIHSDGVVRKVSDVQQLGLGHILADSVSIGRSIAFLPNVL